MKTFFLNARYYGFDIVILIAGLCGAFVFLDKTSNLTWWKKVSSVISGGLIANYLTPLVGKWLLLSDDALYGVAFFLGYGGLKSVESGFTIFNSKINKEVQ